MRISVDANDPGHEAYAEIMRSGRGLRVFLDGEEVRRVITADEEAGWIRALAVAEDGSVVVNAQEDPVEVEHLGVVVIDVVDPDKR